MKMLKRSKLEESRIKIIRNYFKNFLKFNILISSNVNHLVKTIVKKIQSELATSKLLC